MKQELLYQNFVPISRVVNAAIIDSHGDKGRLEQTYTHWAVRGLFEINMHILKSNPRSVYLPISRNTMTAALPIDFNGATFVGYIDDRGFKIPLKANRNLANIGAIEEIPCEDPCPKCNSSKSICDEMKITVSTTIIEINGNNYEQTVTKKLYPNGDYYLETSIPYLDLETQTVIYPPPFKEFITSFDMKDCGCIENTPSNLEKVQICNPDVYAEYYAPCGTSSDLDSYEIFEESGLIQFSQNFSFSKAYMEYRPSMVKINGQYMVPRIGMECLVEWTKYKAIQNKGGRSVNRFDVRDQYDSYRIAKENLRKVKHQFSLARVIRAAMEIPKFDIFIEDYNTGCVTTTTVSPPILQKDLCDVSGYISGGSGIVEVVKGYVPFSFGVIAGLPGGPIDGSSSWQNNNLKDGLNLNTIIINDTTYTSAKGDFTFDKVTGIIDISPNKFFTSDVLVGNYFKLI